MLELILKPIPTPNGGVTMDGFALFDGETVKEVLDEIRKYTRHKKVAYLGNAFGNLDNINKTAAAWSISINGKTYWTAWQHEGSIAKYDHSLDNLAVKEIHVHGGWNCFFDFEIITK